MTSLDFFRTSRRGLLMTLVFAAATGCATHDSRGEASNAAAKVDLRVSATPSPNEVYEPLSEFQVPDDHKVGDKIFPYEGVGWENEIVGYRLYLDERAVTDIFGKRTPDIILDKVDYRSKYHDLADWGMDVMKVGPSLGVGGLGLYRSGSLERFGGDGQISIKVLEESGARISFKVKHHDVPLGNGEVGNVETTYSLNSGSPLTWVRVKSNLPKATLASGLVKNVKGKHIRGPISEKQGEWRYIATWGDKQSEAKDGLGTALFFRDGDARVMPTMIDTFPVRFNSPNPTYAFAGVWEQGPMGITNEESFVAWLDEQQRKLNQ